MKKEFQPIPEGEYNLKITEVAPSLSKKGYPMVKVVFTVLDASGHGKRIFHYVTFMPPKDSEGVTNKGAGMSVHFLKVIGQPYEGKIKVDPFSWINSEVFAKVIVDEYEGKKNNKIKYFITPLDGENKNIDPTTNVEPF